MVDCMGEVNEVTWEWILQSNYMIKVEVKRALRWGVEVRRVLSSSWGKSQDNYTITGTCHIDNGRETTAVTFSISVKYLCMQSSTVSKLTTLFKIYVQWFYAWCSSLCKTSTKNFRNFQQLFSRPAAHTSSFDSLFFQAPSPLGIGFHRLFIRKVTLYLIISNLY